MILNPFDTDAFSMVSLTNAINILPNNYGRVRELGLFPGKGVRTRTVIVEEQNGILNMLPTLPPGAPGTQNKMGKRTVRSFTIPHIPVDDVILPQEYEGIRAFGTESEVAALAQVMNDHLQTAKNKFAITLEHLRMGALKGIILDADGSTIYNLYTEFGITQKTVSFALSSSSTNVASKCREVTRHLEDNLKGEVMTEVRCLVDEGFFDAMIAHDSVKEVFLNHSAAVQYLGGDPRKEFKFGGITFEEYRGVATDLEGNSRQFIADNEGHAFPMGTMNTFQTLFAPADFNETVNTLGLELYAKQEERKFGRGVDLHAQSNPLPICYRPGVLVKVTKG
ncbi:Phage major capsid protein E [Syntrophus gentianae]|uniref:Phage major capsid protein E n=1 Tax=Syntrophus gentianae TaxID=43775 RepID=A0A1H8AZ07_9BACT|nr:major capsid protein [Syntrophus gentianae]SEM75018.1 Phage major capsid protein E [Syntrophus gentianae]